MSKKRGPKFRAKMQEKMKGKKELFSNLYLTLDASTPMPFILLSTDEKIISFEVLEKASEAMAERIRTLLEEAGLKPGQITHLRGGIGPGSYTGIRAALSLIQALELSLNLKAQGFSALGALAPKPTGHSSEGPDRDSAGLVPVAIDARSAGIWGALAEGSLGLVTEPQRISPEEIEPWAAPYGAIWSLQPEAIADKIQQTQLQTPLRTPLQTPLAQFDPEQIHAIASRSQLPLEPNYLGPGHNKKT